MGKDFPGACNNPTTAFANIKAHMWHAIKIWRLVSFSGGLPAVVGSSSHLYTYIVLEEDFNHSCGSSSLFLSSLIYILWL